MAKKKTSATAQMSCGKTTIRVMQDRDTCLASMSYGGAVSDCCTCMILREIEKAHVHGSVRLVSEEQFVLLDVPADKASVKKALEKLEDKIDQAERRQARAA